MKWNEKVHSGKLTDQFISFQGSRQNPPPCRSASAGVGFLLKHLPRREEKTPV